ncbi:hypothetical protein GN956_G22064 [Arapaima gigas]
MEPNAVSAGLAVTPKALESFSQFLLPRVALSDWSSQPVLREHMDHGKCHEKPLLSLFLLPTMDRSSCLTLTLADINPLISPNEG